MTVMTATAKNNDDGGNSNILTSTSLSGYVWSNYFDFNHFHISFIIPDTIISTIITTILMMSIPRFGSLMIVMMLIMIMIMLLMIMITMMMMTMMMMTIARSGSLMMIMSGCRPTYYPDLSMATFLVTFLLSRSRNGGIDDDHYGIVQHILPQILQNKPTTTIEDN